MAEKFIDKKIAIQSPVSKTWKVLVKKHYIEQWISEFSAGNVVTEDWQKNSKVAMTDEKGNVLVEGTITEFEPEQKLKMEFENIDYTEELSLTAHGHLSHLSILAGPVADAEYKAHSEVWEKGLNKIKELSEKG